MIERDLVQFEFAGPIGSRVADLSDSVTMGTYTTMFSEFATAVQTGEAPALDVNRGLHVQRVVEAADTELLLRH